VPVEPSKRFSFIFTAERPLDQELPLTIDPLGVHFRQDGPQTYLAGGHAEYDPAVDYDDFTMDHGIWENFIWPTIAARIPQFDALKIVTEWAGHYAYNTLDQNAIIGPHNQVENFMFLNGFSGHGLQQSPAMGRGMSELLTYGEFRSLDLSPLGYDRIVANRAFIEKAVI
jgi:glycine/D-amino acid oxidase-like deaminating enzyme